jgi:hypothetical protein
MLENKKLGKGLELCKGIYGEQRIRRQIKIKIKINKVIKIIITI